jgi:hypothetical protein
MPDAALPKFFAPAAIRHLFDAIAVDGLRSGLIR